MAGYPLRIGDVSLQEGSILDARSHSAENLIRLRRFLLRLALDTHRPEEALSKACHAIRETTGCICSFIEGEFIPDAAPGHLVVPVISDSCSIGALIIQNNGSSIADFGHDDLQEIAELVGLALMNANQAQAVSELQSDSEDMLFHAPDAVFVATADGIIQLANRKVLEFIKCGLDEIIGHPMSSIFKSAPITWDLLASSARNGEALEVELSGPIGRRLASLTPSFVGDERSGKILCVMRDITAEHQARLAIRRTERSLLMGQAVEYLLHEINNPLSALLANLSRVQKHVEQARGIVREPRDSACFSADVSTALEKLRPALSNAVDSSSRIRDTMSVLRAAHIGKVQQIRSLVDVSYEISLALSSMELENRHSSVTIHREISVRGKIHTTPLTIAEAVSALVRNALQALENRENGAIWIIAEETDTALRIVVNDNGPGVPSHLVRQIFMPFFTTKPLGQSLGLGLTMVDDALRRLGGSLRFVPSEKGACFEMLIPK